MLNNAQARSLVAHAVDPVARLLLRIGLTPDVVTVTGTVGVVAAALLLIPSGHLFAAAVIIATLALTDMIDGAMARSTGRSGAWGAFLDSTLDRISDAAVFAAVVIWFAGDGDDATLLGLALFCMIGGAVVSYAKARAEGLGLRCDVGIAERTERLMVLLFAIGFEGLGVPYAATVGLWFLAVITTVTVVQRVLEVRRQTRAAAPRT